MRIIQLENPAMVFLMETNLKEDEVQRIKMNTDFKSDLVVDCIGMGRERAGGLCLLWKDPFEIQISSFSQNHIGVVCQIEDKGNPWFFGGVYGFPEEQNKGKTWQLVQNIHQEFGHSLLYSGDFNDLIQDNDKIGGNSRSPNQFSWSRQTLETFDLHDLGFEGHPYT